MAQQSHESVAEIETEGESPDADTRPTRQDDMINLSICGRRGSSGWERVMAGLPRA